MKPPNPPDLKTSHGPGIELEPHTTSLADGTSTLQSGRSPSIPLDPPIPDPHYARTGNPGKYLGIHQIRFKHFTKGWTTGRFHVIEAIKGTWLSAATKKFGWDKIYGPEDGYGAYVEGIVRAEDGSYMSHWDLHHAADKLKPGELFAIEIYKDNPEQRPNRETSPNGLSPEDEHQIRPDDTIIGIASSTGLAVEIAGNIFAPIAIVGIFFNLKSVSSNPDIAMVEARANCYARTSFTYRKNEAIPTPLSKVFDRLKWKQDLYEQAIKRWKKSWKETIDVANKKFHEEYVRIYQEVSRHGGRPLGELQLRNALKNITQQKYGPPEEFCDLLLERVAKSNWWTDAFPATVRPIWEKDRATKFPI